MKNDSSQQMVLVFHADILGKIGRFQGYTLDVERYLSVILNPNNNFFMHRELAECDDRYKQLIPYIILRFNNSFFTYVRGKDSSEERLVKKRSIGLGGHIEPTDNRLFSSNTKIYFETAKREVFEEVFLETNYNEHVSALINDDSNLVGKVHFGIVHIWDLEEPKVRKREGKITEGRFESIESLRSSFDHLETWSQIALKIMEKIQSTKR